LLRYFRFRWGLNSLISRDRLIIWGAVGISLPQNKFRGTEANIDFDTIVVPVNPAEPACDSFLTGVLPFAVEKGKIGLPVASFRGPMLDFRSFDR
jgi:hypothetical protein